MSLFREQNPFPSTIFWAYVCISIVLRRRKQMAWGMLSRLGTACDPLAPLVYLGKVGR